MGVPNLGRYEITHHAMQRYKERIDPAVKNGDAIKALRQGMTHATFLENANRNCQAWLTEDNTVLILNTARFEIVTVYKSDDSYRDMFEKGDVLSEPSAIILSDLVGPEIVRSKKKYYFALSTLYEQYAERATALTNTTRQDRFDATEAELLDLRKDIEKIESERNLVVSELSTFVRR